MKTIKYIILLFAGILINSSLQAQLFTETLNEEIKFDNNSADNLLKVNNINGDINVVGYDGSTVQIEAIKSIDAKKNILEKAKSEIGFKVEKKGNEIHVFVVTPGTNYSKSGLFNQSKSGNEGYNFEMDFNIKVPNNSNIKLIGVNSEVVSAKNLTNKQTVINNVNGDIILDKISSEVEVNTVNGNLNVTNVNGSVIASSVNGTIKVNYTTFNTNKSNAFSSVNGDLDISLPQQTKANIKASTNNGEVDSDFEVITNDNGYNSKNSNSKYHVKIGDSVNGTINGGGSKISLNTLNGSIYIRSN